MIYNDFEIRAWQADQDHIQVLVHSSPAGDMLRPLMIAVDPAILSSIQQQRDTSWYQHFQDSDQIIEIGRQLATILLPPPVYELLLRSQERIGPQQGLRLRLCFDDRLMDYPWEWLYRPNRFDAALDGFLAVDPQLSLVRGAPMRPLGSAIASATKQRLVFAGALWHTDTSDDHWGVRPEYEQLVAFLKPVAEYLAPEFITAADDNIEQTLSTPVQIFHYSGHADADRSRAYIVKSIDQKQFQDPLYCETLGISLRRAQTRIALLMACNSGRWQVARPLLHAGLPVLIGVQGAVTNIEAMAFSQRIYNYLGAGLSLDEAVSDARVDLLDLPLLSRAPAAGLARFIVYMPSRDAILIPRPDDAATAEIQREVKQINIHVIQNIEKIYGGTVTGVEIKKLVTTDDEQATANE
jgi:hypothetical protein